MSILRSLSGAAAILLLQALASPVGAEEIPAWALMFSAQWDEAYNARNAESFEKYYAEHATVNEWSGREAVIQGLKQEWQELNDVCEGDLRELKIVNEYAVGLGVSGCRPKGTPVDQAELSEWLTVWQRQSGGDWRVMLEQW